MRILINTILFLIISTAAWAAGPAAFYSDLTSGPNTGGQNNSGVFVTIWGNNFGSTQGNSYVTVGGGKVNNYPTWTNTMICFQLGASAATGNIVVTTSSGSSNGIPFTVRSGNIYFVNPSAASNGSGTYASPFNHLWYAYNTQAAGDTVYVESGIISDEEDGYSGWHSIITTQNAGTQADPIAYVAYPNATVILQADGGTATWTDGSSGGNDQVQYIFRDDGGSWTTISKFTMELTGTGAITEVDAGTDTGWRVVGNTLTANAYVYAQIDFAGPNTEVIGNTIYNSGAGMNSSNEDHSIYLDGASNPFEIGWNYLYGNQNSGWEISCFHQGQRNGAIHDNLIIAGSAGGVKGILLGDVDTGETQSTEWGSTYNVYNNILVNTGQADNGGAMQLVDGTGYIYNNTIYYSGTETKGVVQVPTTGVGPNGGGAVWYFADNIIVANNAGLYISDENGSAPNWSFFALLADNNYYGEGGGPTNDTTAINANPQFVSPGTIPGTNFQLQAASPDIDAGYNTTAIVPKDFSGLVRGSTPSIGAYEYTGSSSPSSPVVAITSPNTGVSITAGSNVSITANASEGNGTITNISIYNGSTLLGASSSSPYTYVMNDPAAGVYTLKAVATDAKGVSTTSSLVIVTVLTQSVLPSSPVVTITSPATGSSYKAGSNVTITTTASETNGTIKNISLYTESGVLLGSSSSSPYNYVYSNILAGGYSFYAVARDASGVTTTSSTVTINVTAVSSPPTVSLVAPLNNIVFTAPVSFTLTANASETNGTITQVQFYSGTTLLNTDTSSPYSYTLYNESPGTYTFTAKATDANGVVVTSSPITVIVNSSPVVAITNPADGSSLTAGSTLKIAANASEANGTIAQVQFYYGSILLGTSTTSPYSYTIKNIPTGTYSLTAVATDTNGVSATSAPVTVTISTASQPVPTVSLVAPLNNIVFTAPVSFTLTANASETNGTITQVQFYSGTTLLNTDTSSPYSYTLYNESPGTYTFTAKATDANGVVVTSSPITVIVNAPPPVPTVSLVAPLNGIVFTAPVSVTISAAASETNGTISKVQFYNGTTLLYTDTSSPYNYTWYNIPPGIYNFTAKATDTNGVVTTSLPTTMTIL